MNTKNRIVFTNAPKTAVGRKYAKNTKKLTEYIKYAEAKINFKLLKYII